MLLNRKALDLTPEEIDIIEGALQTQEKILQVQSRAGADSTVLTRLDRLKDVSRTLRRHAAQPPAQSRVGRFFARFG